MNAFISDTDDGNKRQTERKYTHRQKSMHTGMCNLVLYATFNIKT